MGVSGWSVLACFVAPVALAHEVQIHVTGPERDWCSLINTGIAPGDIVLLEPGNYVGPCDLVGRPLDEGEVTLIQPLDGTDLPHFLHDGGSEYILLLGGRSLVVMNAVFEGVPEGAVGVRIQGEEALALRFGTFLEVDGTGVEVLGGRGVSVDGAWFVGPTGRPAVFGCADGSCPVDGWTFNGNLLIGPSGAVLVHPAAYGTIANNVADQLTGLLVEYAGSGGSGRVEGNLFVGDGPVLDVQGDDLTVRNNILVGGMAVGATASGLAVLGNTLLGAPGVTAGGTALRFEGNALEEELALGSIGNVVCTDRSACWEDVTGWDFRPVVGGPLDGGGGVVEGLVEDFCGTVRYTPVDAGALERTEGVAPLLPTFKSDQPCAGEATVEPPPVEPAPRGSSTGRRSQGGRGCSSTGGGPVWAWAWVVILGCASRVNDERHSL